MLTEVDDVTGCYSFVLVEADTDTVWTVHHCKEGVSECLCGGWTVWEYLDDEDPGTVEYSTCVGVDVCPDCLSDRHPGCCGEHS